MTDRQQRFTSGSGDYSRFRPDYPGQILRHVADALPASTLPILDIGSGTGIFTRQLARLLPPDVPIVGVETSAAMRAEAAAQTRAANLVWREGAAEALPFADNAARAVTAATAAHWFDRPRFFAEAARVLAPGGLLAIVEYVRDENSPAARAVIDFLARHGEPRAYARPDYVAELAALPAFDPLPARIEPIVLRLSPADYAGLALSSSHARAAVAALGRAEAERRLCAIGEELLEAGCVPFGYVFQAFLARRR